MTETFILDRIAPTPRGCWEWQSYVNESGYGQTAHKGRNWLAHRLVWTLLVGPIPEGMYLDHACRNRRCVHIHHLRVVTPKRNAIENSIGPTAVNARKTHCVNGHPYEGENLASRADGGRRCRRCAVEQVAKRRQRPEVRAQRNEWQRRYVERNREQVRARERETYRRRKALKNKARAA